ncbi:MAG: hypothetical protein HYZ53_23315 [Planctomycetes bacterium]|nr:hypothetical protein [Planctomycetota bacterium]
MLDKLNELMKRLTGRREVSDEMTTLLKNPKKRKDALKLARETRHRLEDSKARALDDVGVLTAKEKELLEKGRSETGASQRVYLARQVQEVRAKIAEINRRIETSLAKPLKVYQVLTQLLENLVAQEEQPIPEMKLVEDLAIADREYGEKIDQTVAMVEGLQSSMSTTSPDQDLEGILSEMEKDAGGEHAKDGEEEDPDDLFGEPDDREGAAGEAKERREKKEKRKAGEGRGKGTEKEIE